MYNELNLRDLGGLPFADGTGAVPRQLFLRSGKLSQLSAEQCRKLCESRHIRCVIDLRTPVEAAEFPDLLPPGVDYRQIPLLKDATVGITHETGSDPMAILRNLRRHPEKLKAMLPDFKALYLQTVTDPCSRAQLQRVVDLLRANAQRGICTLFHCTAGKDRTGIVSMALLKSYGVSHADIVRDYLRTNRHALLPTLQKCIAVGLLTRSGALMKAAYRALMANREWIELALEHYDPLHLGNQ